MTSYHLDDPTLAGYAADRLDDLAAWSVEAHLDHCAPCRSRLPLSPPAPPAVLPAQGRSRPGTRVRRTLLLVAAGPGGRLAWLVSLAATAALLGTAAAGDLPVRLLLLVAPVLPVLGTAASYGPHADPMHDVVAASPYGGLRIVLWRTLSVLVASAPVLAAAGAVAGVGSPVLWLLPGVALTTVTLALATLLEPAAAATLVAVGWSALVLGAPTGRALVATLHTAGGTPIWLTVIAAAAALAYARRTRLGQERHR